MVAKCGECLLFQGAGKCGKGTTTHSSNPVAGNCNSLKVPASLFESKKCGGCRLFKGGATKCDKGTTTHSNNPMAKTCSSYAPIPG